MGTGTIEATPATGSNVTCKLCGSGSSLLHDGLFDRLVGTIGSWRILHCTNNGCGLAWIDPVPSPEQLAAAYENYYTHSGNEGGSRIRRQYDRLRAGYLSSRFGYAAHDIKPWEKLGGRLLACLPHRRAAFDASVMWLPATSGGRVLEIGCGNGNLLARLADLGWQAQGIEPDPKAAKIARDRGLPVIAGELTDQSFESEAFDAIIMSHVIEHIGDPVSLLRRCRQILKPGGRVIMLTPNLGAMGYRWLGRNWLHLDPPRHLNLFTPESMSIACRHAGFISPSCETVLRDANWTLAASISLCDTGHYQIGKLSRTMRGIGLILLYLEWLILKFNKNAGEELLVVAYKATR